MSQQRHLIWVYQSFLANLVGPAARRLREEHQITTTLVCYNRNALPVPGRHDFDPSDIAEIFELDPYLRIDRGVDRTALAEWSMRATEIERRYGISLMEAIRADRIVGIDYVVGAQFPKSRYAKDLDYPRSVATAVTVAEAIDDLLRRTEPVAVVGASGALAPALLWRMAMARDIPVRTLVVARSGAGLYWSDDDYMRPINFTAAMNRIAARSSAPDCEEAAHEAEWLPTPVRAQVAMRAHTEQSTLRSLARQLLRATRKRLVKAVRGRGGIYGTYLLRDQLKLILNRWRWRRHLRKEPSAFEAMAADTPFVFFPLQIEPESTLMFESPMCDNSLTVLDWLAKTVPAGWLVVVKEHPAATAPRPRRFWEQVRRYPNVLVAGTLEDGESIVRRARAVIVQNSSLGVQAACLGKPVVTYHPAFIGAGLGHVQVADSYEATMSALRRVRDDDLPPVSQRVLEGRALRQALDETQFPASDEQILTGVATENPIERSDFEAIISQLIESLPDFRRHETWLENNSTRQ